MLILENERRNFFFPPVDNDFSIPSGKEERGVSFKTALKTCPSEAPVVREGGAWLLGWCNRLLYRVSGAVGAWALLSLGQGNAVEPKASCLTLPHPLAAQKRCI